jgi:hypothetical protein
MLGVRAALPSLALWSMSRGSLRKSSTLRSTGSAEFGPLAGVCVALVRGHWDALRRSARALLVGFAVGMPVAFLLTALGRLAGAGAARDATPHRPADRVHLPAGRVQPAARLGPHLRVADRHPLHPGGYRVPEDRRRLRPADRRAHADHPDQRRQAGVDATPRPTHGEDPGAPRGVVKHT